MSSQPHDFPFSVALRSTLWGKTRWLPCYGGALAQNNGRAYLPAAAAEARQDTSPRKTSSIRTTSASTSFRRRGQAQGPQRERTWPRSCVHSQLEASKSQQAKIPAAYSWVWAASGDARVSEACLPKSPRSATGNQVIEEEERSMSVDQTAVTHDVFTVSVGRERSLGAARRREVRGKRLESTRFSGVLRWTARTCTQPPHVGRYLAYSPRVAEVLQQCLTCMCEKVEGELETPKKSCAHETKKKRRLTRLCPALK